MAANRPGPNFLMTDLLQILRAAARRDRSLTTLEIRRLLLRPLREGRYSFWEFHVLPFMEDPALALDDWLHHLLVDLQSIGIVSSAEPEGGGRLRWRLNARWEAGAPPWGSDGGGDGPPTPGAPGVGDGDGGAGGFGEVLAHRYLFALSPEDFEDALDRALGGIE